jgi:hypothetical protein
VAWAAVRRRMMFFVRGGLILVALAGAACGEELAAAVRAQLHAAKDEIINIPGSTSAGQSISFGEGGTTISSSSSSSTNKFDVPLVCQGTCPSTFQGKPLPFAVTQVTSQGVQYCVPATATLQADGSITSTLGGIEPEPVPVFTPGQNPPTCGSAASAVSPVIMAIVGVLLSMVL